MALTKAIVSIQKRALVLWNGPGAFTTGNESWVSRFMSILGDQLDAGDVKTPTVHIEGADDFYLFTLVLPRSVLIVKLIRLVARCPQYIAGAFLNDRTLERRRHWSQILLSRRRRRLLVRLLYVPIRGRQRLGHGLRSLKLRPGD